jgi:hypothetical protein
VIAEASAKPATKPCRALSDSEIDVLAVLAREYPDAFNRLWDRLVAEAP